MRKSEFIFAASALASALLAGGCSRAEAVKKSTPDVPVLVAQAFATNVPVQIQPAPVGHVTAYSTVAVRSQITGILEKVHFQEGQDVKAGDLLFTIDQRPSQAALVAAQAAVTRDQAQFANAKIQFERDQKLFDAKIESQDVFDTSKANLDALAGTLAADGAAVTNAQLNLENCQIRAPFDGKTGSVPIHAGNVIKAQDDVLLTINRIHPIYVAFAVPERYLAEIKKEMRARKLAVRAAYEGMTGAPPAGELSFIDNAVDETTGTLQLKATFPNADNTLWPGQFVRVTLDLSELTDAVVIPSQAVQVGQNGQFIYVVKPDQSVEMRPVKTGITLNNLMVVETGLKAGETVVTDGQLRLAPGVKVSVKDSGDSANNSKAESKK
jgi:multidrug efflux system membrane fusion protein